MPMNQLRRLVVEGESMRPTLLPGDRVVAVGWRRPRPGELVAAHDPRVADRILVKRVVSVDPIDGVTVAGDNPDASTDSRVFGVIPWSSVVGRVVYRYSPSDRAGRVG
jgi:nickel-type superoxide dismutase maturation protease